MGEGKRGFQTMRSYDKLEGFTILENRQLNRIIVLLDVSGENERKNERPRTTALY